MEDVVDDTDEEPDVDDIEVNAAVRKLFIYFVIKRPFVRKVGKRHVLNTDNSFYVPLQDIDNGVRDNISAVTEFLDEETCMDMLRYII